MIIVISQFQLLQRETSVCGCGIQVTEALLQPLGSVTLTLDCCLLQHPIFTLQFNTS